MFVVKWTSQPRASSTGQAAEHLDALSAVDTSRVIDEESIPVPRRYYRSLIPEVPIALCPSCNHFFNEDDFEFEVLQKGGCPFCGSKQANLSLQNVPNVN